VKAKTLILLPLARVGLLKPAYRAYEGVRVLASVGGDVKPRDGLPLPPASLRMRVAGGTDATWFLRSGRKGRRTLRTALERAGADLSSIGVMLDFGCGCGRVARHLSDFSGQLLGSDIDATAVEWCRANLPFGGYSQNELEPPLAYTSASIDLAYAFSVFTHLPVALQHAWVAELERVLRPGGLLLVTTHGERYLTRLSEEERQRFRKGEVVVRFEEVAGTNLCTAFHPPEYVLYKLAGDFEVLDFAPEGAKGNPYQDLYLLRKPLGKEPADATEVARPHEQGHDADLAR
jgi:SAM-dependent methyltransferase